MEEEKNRVNQDHLDAAEEDEEEEEEEEEEDTIIDRLNPQKKRKFFVLSNAFIYQCSTFRKISWGQLAPKFSFLLARTSILVAKNYI